MNSNVTSVIAAVVLNCNSRCRMCDIWQNKIKSEVRPEFYNKLPKSLKDINLTGGEPFLRRDLSEIVRIIRNRCPEARILINTNGFLVKSIDKQLKKILEYDKKIAIRISLDGWGKNHDRIRGIKEGFEKCMESLKIMKELGVKDLGIAFTLMKDNVKDLEKIFDYCVDQGLVFSLTLVSESPIYFGKDKQEMRPKDSFELKKVFKRISKKQYLSFNPKDWGKAWFNNSLYEYLKAGKRSLVCDAGKKWVYVDSLGKVYSCQMKPWLLGDLKKKRFKEIINSKKMEEIKRKVNKCNDCWMVCSARTSMKSNLIKLSLEVIRDKMRYSFS